MRDFVRLLLTGGLAPKEYDSIKDSITEDNRRNILYYASVASVFFCVLCVASQLVSQGPPSGNLWIYIVSCAVMAAISVCAHYLAQKGPKVHVMLVSVLTYVFMIVLHVFSLTLSMAHPQYPAVSAIVFLLVNPLLFVDRPIRAMTLTLLATSAVCLTSVCAKSPALAADDVWNAVTFGVIALVIDVIVMRTKLTKLYQACEIAYLSRTDTLTQLRNRNNYESRLEDYPRADAKVLVCAYVDANGLRETNNTHGHDAGDKLLCAIARQMRERFGEKDTYRIGGDEFVAIIPDGSLAQVRKSLEGMQKELAAQRYFVSCGAAETASKFANMRGLVRAAEKEMYAQKREHYARQGLTHS